MSDPVAPEVSPASSPAVTGPIPWVPLALAAGLVLLALLAALIRPLSTSEAEVALMTTAFDGRPASLQTLWADWAGSMPRVLRGAGLLGFLFGLGGLGLWAGRGARPGLLALAAVPAVGMQASGLAGGTPYLAGLMALVLALRLTGLSRRVCAHLGLIVAGGLPFLLHPTVTERALADLDIVVLSGTGPVSLLMLALTALVALRAGAVPLLLLLLMAAAWVTAGLREGLLPLLFATPAAAGALALSLTAAVPEERKPTFAPRALAALALLSIALIALLGGLRTPDPLPPRAADLDWITTRVDQRALLLHAGARGAHYRYLELRGHRTGHPSVRAANDEEIRSWGDRALLRDLRLIAVTTTPEARSEAELAEALGPRWRPLPQEGEPASVRLFRRE